MKSSKPKIGELVACKYYPDPSVSKVAISIGHIISVDNINDVYVIEWHDKDDCRTLTGCETVNGLRDLLQRYLRDENVLNDVESKDERWNPL